MAMYVADSEDESEDAFTDVVNGGPFSWCNALGRRKSLESILEEAAENAEADGAKLNLFDLLCIGIGGTIGSGVFALTGAVLPVAGPGATVSWALAGLTCLLSAFAYMELSAKLPTRGSCYAFSYHGLGEVWAVLGGCCLTLEYCISGAGVARSWSAKFVELTGMKGLIHWWGKGTFENNTNVVMLRPANYTGNCYTASHCSVQYAMYRTDDHYFDYAAGALCLFCTIILMGGTSFGKIFINGLTLTKVLLVAAMIVAGFGATGILEGDIFSSGEQFFPKGPKGVMDGTVLLFFGFIGFDEVCCMAGKADNPSKVMPRALIGTLIGAVVFSGAAQLALAMMLGDLASSDQEIHFEEAFKKVGFEKMHLITSYGECILMPVLVLITMLPQSELTAAMSTDKLIPSLFRRQSRNGVFVAGTAFIGVVTILVAVFVPFSILWNMISIGVLVGFQLTNASLIATRYGNGGEVRNSQVAKLTYGLLASTAIAAYPFWIGYCVPYFDGQPLGSKEYALAGMSAVAVLVSVGQMIMIYKHETVPGEEGIYEAPLVPFIPGIAMFLNFVLMAGMTWTDHMYFGIAAGVFLLAYLAYTARGTKEPQ